MGALAAVVGGLALAVQSRVNGALGERMADGFFAALVSFVVGLVVLVAVVAVTPSMRAGAGRLKAALRTGELRPWQCAGGAAGAWFVTTQGLTVSLLGVAMFTVGAVAGQVLSSLLVDRAGFGPGGPRPITPTRAVGAVLTVVAVVVAVSDELGSPSRLWLSLVPAVAGAGIGWAQAANGLVGRATGSVTFAATVNFAVGTVVLLIACGVDLLVDGPPDPPPADPLLYLGGLMGVVVLVTGVFAVRYIGVLMLGLGIVLGQTSGAVLVDLVAPAAGEGVRPATLVGIAVTLLAAAVAAVPSGRAAASRGVEPPRVEQ